MSHLFRQAQTRQSRALRVQAVAQGESWPATAQRVREPSIAWVVVEPFALQVRNLSKSFPGVRALDNVSLEVAPGTVHAVMGENGAGKSTLMRILAGLDQPDAGEIRLKGRPAQFRTPYDALKLGLTMIHQELLPFPEMTVAENIFMGQEPTLGFLGWIDRQTLHQEARRLLERLGVRLPPARKMGELSVAEMQTVEIAKALVHRAEVIIMDEPTSAISEREVEALFRVIRDLKAQGVAVIYISHKMDEIFRLADVVTVLRDGHRVASHNIAELNESKLINLMVGRELKAVFPETPARLGQVALAVRGLSRAGKFREVNFELRQGEILGLAGLMGAGRTELAKAIYGLEPAEAGEIWVHGRRVRMNSPRQAIASGLGMVGEDRKKDGLVLMMSVQHNLTLSSLRKCCRGWFINRRQERKVADDQIRMFAIKTPHRDQPARFLSGGNQQKVVMAKTLLTDPAILILDEPTRGIDIGAKAEVYAIISQWARAGKAILMISSELPEILALSHRILVMREGTIAAELDARRTSQEEILQYAMPA
ncbi:MAG: sugar ABC transporter ATP-binding protein [Verrucomicrobia bacterium]|nr:sugar ABC transporter ATP-binding protein [Verrucomicrobiota bacterium]